MKIFTWTRRGQSPFILVVGKSIEPDTIDLLILIQINFFLLNQTCVQAQE